MDPEPVTLTRTQLEVLLYTADDVLASWLHALSAPPQVEALQEAVSKLRQAHQWSTPIQMAPDPQKGSQSVTEASTRELLDEIDWYRSLLEDVQDGRPVRNLDEAKLGYDRAMDTLRKRGKHDD